MPRTHRLNRIAQCAECVDHALSWLPDDLEFGAFKIPLLVPDPLDLEPTTGDLILAALTGRGWGTAYTLRKTVEPLVDDDLNLVVPLYEDLGHIVRGPKGRWVIPERVWCVDHSRPGFAFAAGARDRAFWTIARSAQRAAQPRPSPVPPKVSMPISELESLGEIVVDRFGAQCIQAQTWTEWLESRPQELLWPNMLTTYDRSWKRDQRSQSERGGLIWREEEDKYGVILRAGELPRCVAKGPARAFALGAFPVRRFGESLAVPVRYSPPRPIETALVSASGLSAHIVKDDRKRLWRIYQGITDFIWYMLLTKLPFRELPG